MRDNPAALKYYAWVKHLFALGPNATPQQVLAASLADSKHGTTEPELCDAYSLLAWKYHWRFYMAPEIGRALGFPTFWCIEPGLFIG
jgi:hypothetical protein